MKVNNSAKYLGLLLALQATVNLVLLLNIPFLRPILGFLFLIFIPGYLILRILHEKNNLSETLLYSVGLSLAFLMLLGFLLNSLRDLNFIIKPLSTENMIIFINIAVSLLVIISWVRNRDLGIINLKDLKKYLPMLAYLLIPLLSIAGTLSVRTFASNLFLLSVVAAIPVIFVLILFFSKSSSFPLILITVSLALLFSITFISIYVYGTDIGLEYNVFKETQSSSYLNWQSGNSLDDLSYKSMLSVTILPTIFSNLLNVDGIWVFKVIFPIIFSLVPLALYQLYEPYWGKKAGFVACFFFIASFEFSNLLPTLMKQMIAEFFIVLLFLILFKLGERSRNTKWIIYSLLFLGLVVSHYSTTFIFLFLLFITWFLGRISQRPIIPKIDFSIVVFSLTITFSWYIYLAKGSFEKFSGLIGGTISSFLTEFTMSSSRDILAQKAFGVVQNSTIMHDFGRIIFNVTAILIVIGFIALIIRWKNGQFSNYTLIATAGMLLLFLAVILPRFVTFLNLNRLYHITLMLLAPLLLLGIETILRSIIRLKDRKCALKPNKERIIKICSFLLTSFVLISYFLFQTGFVYEISNDSIPSSISLSFQKMKNDTGFINETDVFSACWLSRYGNVNKIYTWADRTSLDHVLLSYSTIDRNMIFLLSNTTTKWIAYGTFWSEIPMDTEISYVYLSHVNVINGKIAWDEANNIYYNLSENPVLNSTDVFVDKIYSNGASEVYYRYP